MRLSQLDAVSLFSQVKSTIYEFLSSLLTSNGRQQQRCMNTEHGIHRNVLRFAVPFSEINPEYEFVSKYVFFRGKRPGIFLPLFPGNWFPLEANCIFLLSCVMRCDAMSVAAEVTRVSSEHVMRRIVVLSHLITVARPFYAQKVPTSRTLTRPREKNWALPRVCHNSRRFVGWWYVDVDEGGKKC